MSHALIPMSARPGLDTSNSRTFFEAGRSLNPDLCSFPWLGVLAVSFYATCALCSLEAFGWFLVVQREG
jgi:hypothetical protein